MARIDRRFARPVVLLAIGVTLGACSATDLGPATVLDANAEFVLALYVCADGALEERALATINALEAVDFPSRSVAVTALLDLPQGGALLRLVHDPQDSPAVTSVPWDVPGITDPDSPDGAIAMGEVTTLQGYLIRLSELFPGRPIHLAISGAGRGYRSCCIDAQPNPDELTTAELAAALRGTSVRTVSLDASFTAAIEVAYELASRVPEVEHLLAPQADGPEEGWPLAAALEKMPTQPAIGSDIAAEFVAALSAEAEHPNRDEARFSAVSLRFIRAVETALSALSRELEALVVDGASRDALRSFLFHEPEGFYATPGDLSLDLRDLAGAAIGAYPALQNEGLALALAVEAAVSSDSHGISAHYIPLDEHGIAEPGHDPDYRKGDPAAELSFVSVSDWVPAPSTSSGLLYTLFLHPWK